MVIINKVADLLRDVKAYWRVPAKGDYVPYKEYLMLSVGWLGMRLATVFGIAFGVNNPFTAMTLHMTHRDLIILSYICTAIGYALAPLNAYIIDNLRSRAGKYKVYVRLAIPSGILSLIALYFPYEKIGYFPMIISLFLIGQIQGYVQGWYNTGVSNLVYVISPNSRERVRIMMVTSLVHNFAPSLTGLLIPVMSDVLANGDLYNINTYRKIYPAFIIIGVILSMAAYFGVQERIVQPKSQVAGVGLIDALREVSHNKLFWIKCTDSWNNFMEDAKNILMQWLFYYGKVGSMTMYGIMDTVSYNSSMWAMLMSPWLIDRLGKRGFKLVKNISQVFITLGLALTYKKHIIFIGIFYFLNRFWETSEVIDRSIESDIRDYQQYISGERIDGAFGVVENYTSGAIGAVTNLFIPWVYRKNGFDGTDYNVLNVYDDKGNYRPDNILYKLLDVLLKVSLVGAAIDVLPWFFYDLSETEQKSVIRVIRIRSAAQDRKAGICDDGLYCEACEALISSRENVGKEIIGKYAASSSDSRKEVRQKNREIKAANEEIQIAQFVNREIDRFTSPAGEKILELSVLMNNALDGSFSGNLYEEAVKFIDVIPAGKTKEEKTQRNEAVRMIKSIRRSEKITAKFYPGGIENYSAAEFEAVFDMPENTKEEKKAKRAAVREARRSRNIYGRAMKPFIWAKRNIVLAETYADIDSFISDYDETRKRLDDEAARRAAQEAAAREERRAEAKRRNNNR